MRIKLYVVNGILAVLMLACIGIDRVGADTCDPGDYVQTPPGCTGSCMGFYYGWSCLGETDAPEHWVAEQWFDGKLVASSSYAGDADCTAHVGDTLRIRVILATDCGWFSPVSGEYITCCRLVCGDLCHWVGLAGDIEQGPTPPQFGGGWPFDASCGEHGFEWRPIEQTVEPDDVTWRSDEIGWIYTGFALGAMGRGDANADAAIKLSAGPGRSGEATITFPTYRVDSCRGDVVGDGAVGMDDVQALLGVWGACDAGERADWDDSGGVDFADLHMVLSNWGACAPPETA